MTATAFLSSDEPPAVELINPGGHSHAVIMCDHASNRVPRCLDNLGLDALQLADHIAWDPGAAEVTRHLAAHLDAVFLLSGYSRLVIDCNRPLRSPQSIAEQSAGVVVPGNHTLTPTLKSQRIDALFRPYHDTLTRLLDSRAQRPSLLLSIHSFTPVLNGHSRPWHIGVSHGRDRRFAALMLNALRHNGEFVVGDNKPYRIDENFDYTIPTHGDARALPSVMIEIRQDCIGTTEDTIAWAARLATAYRLVEAEALSLFTESPET